ncbi:hypothetical protein N7462_000705 [Penicillium macrosclerotiorum]|uniref:uncharacterized protein n=1 Tax=Penicillium macrosclerotiorum TaxID=303699 RepID=UPI002549A11B|nr:uncharacterized protein N7462_000705 [Penicillium macrosclerotiorum]KAJ5698700.1 hypothetical protein N7462_000705 [Penicillium macrosclerotiorum]
MLGDDFEVSQLAIPAVSVLISFLAYTSQYFFLYFEAAPLRRDEGWKINIFALCIWVCYFRACFVDPGRLEKSRLSATPAQQEEDKTTGRQRWCRRCEAYKPPRAHHCKTCKRCIPKMDHHCPWTSNCVSHLTFPHFIRFLLYAVVGMGYLETLLWERGSIVWRSRDLPSYLGPTVGQLVHLFILFVVNSMTVFALFILLLRSLWSLAFNITTIESWEIERHETLVRRARVLGGYLEGPGGVKIRIRKQEFPYDIGIWSNIRQGMGGSINIQVYLGRPLIQIGFLCRQITPLMMIQTFTGPMRLRGTRLKRSIAAKQRISAADEFMRCKDAGQPENYASDDERQPGPVYGDDSDEGEESWRNAEGERLRDFGVDEDVEFYDEDDIPLGILMEQKMRQQ